MQEATLVMESRGLAPQVRSFTFTDMWSRLYRTESYFLDVSCKPEDQNSFIQGQLLTLEGEEITDGSVRLLDIDNNEVMRLALDQFGQFSFNINQAGSYQLVASLDKDDVKISSFDIH